MNALTWISVRRGAVSLVSIVLIVLLSVASVAQAQQFLPVEQAFSLDVAGAGGRQLDVRVTLAKGVYLYRERFAAQLTPISAGPSIELAWTLPPGDIKHDPNFDKDLEVYHHDLAAGLTLPAGLKGTQRLQVTYQGCAEAGICYPPQHRLFKVSLTPQGEVLDVEPDSASAAVASQPAAEGRANGDRIASALASGRLVLIVPVFLLA
ncbi:MAG TPA: protein-disulfide reductase DsbD N-terminal domain-containing protein, partial [Aquabacterium sp.]|nr:protein-disulfide reductase DsbD N-terminal domain-containing protein [Aquabacterium sp.]